MKFNQFIFATAAIVAIAGIPMMAQAQKSETQVRTYSYDKNGNGFMDADEFTTYFYTRSDADGDGYLGDEEWTVSTTGWYRPYKDVNYNTYTYWDANKDGRLDTNEINTLVEKTGLYSRWDIDQNGRVDNMEFERGAFAAYDDNGDGVLDIQEWRRVLR